MALTQGCLTWPCLSSISGPSMPAPVAGSGAIVLSAFLPCLGPLVRGTLGHSPCAL